ncbi:TetR/AcrR family transcriptional regulator [Phreatobacter stygius]|uniref:TetR/AcrR family transcriptional regulator n=1 Tax=Phreatobacter stygius TaxID=1940610 RepID=A0A4D7B366_9HYPH|nr:TetR/AcrR family transcriptional regulator [Phreatobacter stygius]QCI67964.1 TetR/AcrR family transcriptional regulator [Phreatobacter stygius]
MAEEIAGRGDLIKALELMWGRAAPRRRGPKAKVEMRDLVAAAVHIADTEGITAVSTRRVAEAVGISPMSFYTHIPDKAVLLDLMLDAVAAPAEGHDRRSSFDPAQWRANIGFVAREFRTFLLRHPWVLQVSTHRPGVGPNTIRSYDHFLAAFDGLGLDEVEMDLSVTMIAHYVHGAVRDVARARMVKAETGMSDEEWWHTIAPFLETVDFSAYPTANRVGPVVGELYGLGDPEQAFAFGLERLLDGIGVLIARKNASPG